MAAFTCWASAATAAMNSGPVTPVTRRESTTFQPEAVSRAETADIARAKTASILGEDLIGPGLTMVRLSTETFPRRNKDC